MFILQILSNTASLTTSYLCYKNIQKYIKYSLNWTIFNTKKMFIFYDSYLAFTLSYTTWVTFWENMNYEKLTRCQWNIFLLVLCCPIKSLIQGANFNSRSGVFIIIHRTCLMCNTFFASRISMSFLGNKILTDF